MVAFMPLILHPVLKPAFAGSGFAGCGEVLLAELMVLDGLADQHGLTRLSAFTDTRVARVEFAEILAKVHALPPWLDWFACARGRIACERLGRLVSNATLVQIPFSSPPHRVAGELAKLTELLAVGERHQLHFRLEISSAELTTPSVHAQHASVPGQIEQTTVIPT